MRAFTTIFILLLICGSCKDKDSNLASGVVTGPDLRDCLCCGGYVIEIDDEFYRFENDELPAGSVNFDLLEGQFPVNVRAKWKLKDDGCLGDEIMISKITVLD